MNTLFTIGYSYHTLQTFLNILRQYGMTAVADVRSQPYSRFKPEFNREGLSTFLKKNDIYYVFLGNECGARIDAPECYVNGRADFGLIAHHPLFLSGLERIKKGLNNYTISLMCAEKDPLQCHRAILICRYLKNSVPKIAHILSDGTIETHEKCEKRLLKLIKGDAPDLFKTEAESTVEAYEIQAHSIAFEKNQPVDTISV